jgi:acyl-coenzyme A synthetase/AMP-(fatty) acid ligase
MEHRLVVAADSQIGNSSDLTVPAFVSFWAKRTPDADAIAAPGRPPLTYARLNSHVENTVKTLNKMGLSRCDRVAVVLPNGPEMAATFLSVASGATCAPLNAGYQAEEFDFFLSDLEAKALIVQTGMDSPAIRVAEKRRIDLIRLTPMPEAGAFTLNCEKSTSPASPGYAQAADVALVLHTSGTAARVSSPRTMDYLHFF